jgi:lysylphosphatidylglycerol synthetase-like protein (DUF2156 family)
MVTMLIKLLIILFFFAALIFLFRAVLGLMQDGIENKITLRALTQRLIICLCLILFLLLVYKLGYIDPHPFGIL